MICKTKERQLLTLATVHVAVYSLGFQSLTTSDDRMETHLIDKTAQYIIAFSGASAALGLLLVMWLYVRYAAVDGTAFKVCLSTSGF
jgi:hypothetical protein